MMEIKDEMIDREEKIWEEGRNKRKMIGEKEVDIALADSQSGDIERVGYDHLMT